MHLFKLILQATQKLHYLRIIHRDIKEKNIFIKHNDINITKLVLGDFGIAMVRDVKIEN